MGKIIIGVYKIDDKNANLPAKGESDFYVIRRFTVEQMNKDLTLNALMFHATQSGMLVAMHENHLTGDKIFAMPIDRMRTDEIENILIPIELASLYLCPAQPLPGNEKFVLLDPELTNSYRYGKNSSMSTDMYFYMGEPGEVPTTENLLHLGTAHLKEEDGSWNGEISVDKAIHDNFFQQMTMTGQLQQSPFDENRVIWVYHSNTEAYRKVSDNHIMVSAPVAYLLTEEEPETIFSNGEGMANVWFDKEGYAYLSEPEEAPETGSIEND